MRDAILSLNDKRTKTVFVPQWKQTVTVQEMGLDQGMAFARMVGAGSGKVELDAEDIAGIIAGCVIDEAGERVFSDEDVPALARKSQKALLLLYGEIVSLSGDIEEAAKN